MEIDRKELKAQARARMRCASPPFWLVAFVYFLATSGVSLVVDLMPFSSDTVLGISTLALFSSILLTLYSWILSFGHTLWSLWTWRELAPGIGSLLEGFSVAGRVILLELSILVRIIGWTILGSLGATFAGMLFMGAAPVLTVVLVYGVTYAVAYAATLKYSQARYLLADRPDDGVTLAIHRSVEMMQGWKWELFKLEFSFLGWDLLNLAVSLTVTIFFWTQSAPLASLFASDPVQIYQFFILGNQSYLYSVVSTFAALPLFLWLTPYRNVTLAGFYDERLRLQQKAAEEMPLL